MLQADVESEVRERKTLHRLAGGGGDTGEFGGPFDEEAVRLQVEERQAELRRVPGQEPQMVPVYTEASTPTDAAQLPRGEQSRQIAAKGVRMYAVILVDGKIVGTSGVTNLHPHDFCAPFDSAVQLQLLHAPTTMSVQLWERRLGGLADSMVSESFLAVPDVASPPMPDWQMYSFSAERTFTPRAAYQLGAKEDAAADSDLDADVRRLPRRCVSGQLAVSIAWSAQPATRTSARRARRRRRPPALARSSRPTRVASPSRVHTPRCPAPSIRSGWASTCAPTSSIRTLRRTRRCSRCWRAPTARAPRARSARTASPTSSSGCAAARRRSPTARGSSTSAARGRSSGVGSPPTSGSFHRPTRSSRGGCANC